MNGFEFVREAQRSESIKESEHVTPGRFRLIHASLGLTTESAEFADMLKRSMFYNYKVDRINALEEMGDILWYMAIVVAYFNTSFEKVMEANIAKLQFRYPDQFDEVNAIARDSKTEREILEKIFGDTQR